MPKLRAITTLSILSLIAVSYLYTTTFALNFKQNTNPLAEYGRVNLNAARARLDDAIPSIRTNSTAKIYIFAGAPGRETCQWIGRGRNRKQVCTNNGKALAQRRINFVVGYLAGGVPRSQRQHDNTGAESPDVVISNPISKNRIVTEARNCSEEFTRVYLVPGNASAPNFSCQ